MSCKNTGKASLLFNDCGCGCKGKKQEHKLVISTMSALVFFAVANPEVFRITRKLFGSWVSTPTGCPSTRGLILHAVVFLLVTWALMNINREKADGATAIEPAAEAVVAVEETVVDETVAVAETAVEEPDEEDGEIAAYSAGGGATLPDSESARLATVAMNGDTSMSQAMGAPNESELSSTPLKQGQYQQCRCTDGSSVMLMR
jgi:hypothetical protein